MNTYYKNNQEKLRAGAYAYYVANRDIINKKKRDKRNSKRGWGKRKMGLVRGYNIKWTEYQNLIVRQNNLCAICNNPETRKNRIGVIHRLHIDHNHITGKVRGLLCNRCNLTLGQVKDDISLLEKMGKYLGR